MSKILGKIFGNAGGSVLQKLSGVADKFITTGDEKRAFQKGTNFKDYIEEVILNDVEINFRNRKKLFHCIGDNFERIFGFKHKGMRDTLSGTEGGFDKWI